MSRLQPILNENGDVHYVSLVAIGEHVETGEWYPVFNREFTIGQVDCALVPLNDARYAQ